MIKLKKDNIEIEFENVNQIRDFLRNPVKKSFDTVTGVNRFDKKFKRYTPEELRFIWENKTRGKTARWISRKLGRTLFAVNTQLTKIKKSRLDKP